MLVMPLCSASLILSDAAYAIFGVVAVLLLLSEVRVPYLAEHARFRPGSRVTSNKESAASANAWHCSADIDALFDHAERLMSAKKALSQSALSKGYVS